MQQGGGGERDVKARRRVLKVQGRGHRCFSGCRGLRGFVAASGAVVALLRARAYGGASSVTSRGRTGSRGQ